ncbi:M56 family metallopeptidase [Mycobacterium sp. 1274756.6]|uniref:M56 family metallopeptidase n=1 Tax=Mycobacterium sp. 1274756.6 TaxID=1834076 RepID=UPI0008004AA9|nr:M56 family metallopeptidase [Mycobacterium sp. 1274756.6]OBJ67515.1 peptidase M56 [Mycobacterium sp. 1274756.6]
MNAVTFLLLYAVAVSWLAPSVLTGAAAAEIPPRLSVAGWLAAVLSALSAWVSALVILIVGAARSLLTHTALTFCVKTLGLTGAAALPPAVSTVVVVALLIVTTTVAAHTARRVIGTLLRTRCRNRDHAEAVRLVGRPTGHSGVVALGAERPTAYCVAGGGRSAIVVTTAALKLLAPAGLAAVLAHERAHLRGRHHHIIAILTALTAALPRLPLMREAARRVPPLLEMCADDVAARQHGRGPLLASLVTLSTRRPLPDGALAAAGTAVAERVLRLMEPAHPSGWHPRAGWAALGVAAILAGPGVALTLCAF